jgi:hypothetical protein
MPKTAHLRTIPVAQMYKAILGQKASSELISIKSHTAHDPQSDQILLSTLIRDRDRGRALTGAALNGNI